jgi:hypothetical protein
MLLGGGSYAVLLFARESEAPWNIETYEIL